MSVILNVAPVETLIWKTGGLELVSRSRYVLSVITQSLDQLKDKDTSHLINGISNVLQKLLKCFNRTENSTCFVFASSAFFFPVILALYLKDSELVIGSVEISI